MKNSKIITMHFKTLKLSQEVSRQALNKQAKQDLARLFNSIECILKKNI